MSQRNKFKIFNQLDCVWATQKLIHNYSGPGIRVRRSSDNAEKDIYFDGGVGSWLNEQELMDFVGGNDGRVVKIYDQNQNKRKFQCVSSGGSSNSEETNLYQNTANNQPTIVSTGFLNRDKNQKPLIKGNNSTPAIRFALARTLQESQSSWNGARICLDAPPTSDAFAIYTNQTSQRHKLYVEGTAQEYKLQTQARADVMQGTDSNYYYCTSASTANSANRPITGASWATKWAALPVGNSTVPVFDYDANFAAGYPAEDYVNYFKMSYTPVITMDTSIFLTSIYNIDERRYVITSSQDYNVKESNDEVGSPRTGYTFDTATGLGTEASPQWSQSTLGRFGERLDGYTHAFLSYREDNAFYEGLYEQLQMVVEVA